MGRITELLRTRAFQVDVAGRTSLAPLVGNLDGEARLGDLLYRGVVLSAVGDHVLVVRFSGPNSQISYEICKALVEAYQDKTAADRADQASVAVSFYQSRVKDAQQQTNAAGQEMRRYLGVRQAFTDPANDTSTRPDLPAVTLDPKLGELQGNVQAAQTELSLARTSLDQAQRDAAAAIEGQQLGFQVLDAPVAPRAPTRQFRKMLVYPIAALVVALGLSSILLVLFVAGDRTARADADLAQRLRVLGSVPMLKVKLHRAPKGLRAVAARRAIGSAAGTALPAPSGAK
jgi:hypothetical protein